MEAINMESISSQSLKYLTIDWILTLLKLDFAAIAERIKCDMHKYLIDRFHSTVFFTTRTKTLELKDLQKMVQKSRSDVQRYLNLGWIGVREILAEKGLGMDHLMDLWQEFLSFLLLLQYFCLKLGETLALWEKVLYLLILYLTFSEFPNKIRPPCTTMPWTIWPALVVLWGVCWMFYDGWDQGDHGELPKAGSVNGLFEDINNINLCEDFELNFDDFSFDDISFDMSILKAPHFNHSNLDQQLQLGASGAGAISDAATSLDSIPTLFAVNPADTTSLPFMGHADTSGTVAVPSFISDPATTIMSKAIGNRQREASESRALVPLTALVHRQPRDSQAGPSRNSKHSQTEKYLCTYLDCVHSQIGSGFKRKDHLDQHLRGLHKQTSVQRLRAKPATASSTSNPIATSDTTTLPFQSKKRKRSSEDETSGSNLDQLEKELAEERRLRRIAEEDNHLLRQKLESYERRMEKYEARLDRMMNLLEEHKRE